MKRPAILLAAGAGTLAALSVVLPERHPLVWNVSGSVPTGLYWIAEAKELSVGDRVAIEPPPALRIILDRRGYLPSGLPLLKRVAAISGQQVCRFRHGIMIDGRLVVLARARDTLGRPLPRWSGCKRLGKGDIFTLNPDQAHSFDGRYFGVLAAGSVIGRGLPVLTRERQDGRLVRFADPYAAPSRSSVKGR